jgi:hypothetical protein
VPPPPQPQPMAWLRPHVRLRPALLRGTDRLEPALAGVHLEIATTTTATTASSAQYARHRY